MTNQPNFFLVGAPKAGTTALYEYLREHPNVCMSKIKEPHYFASDFESYPRVRDEREYLALFRHCHEDHTAVGEASVWYLYSAVALPLIRERYPDARIVVALRNPIDLAYSLHSQAVYNFNEDEPDFMRAWALQEQRLEGKHIPARCKAPQILQYKMVASLGWQVERLQQLFPESQIKYLFFDDLVADVSAVYAEVLDFLGLEHDGRIRFDPVNEGKGHRFHWLGKMTQAPPGPALTMFRFLRKRMGLNFSPFLNSIRRLNDRPRPRPPLSAALRKQLAPAFSGDVKRLAYLTGRNLDHWLN